MNEKLLITFFHSGLDQRKQTGGVIVALLKIRTKKKEKKKKKKTALGIISVFFCFFSTGHFLNHVTVVLLVCASKCGQSFGRSRKHGNILLVWIKAELFKKKKKKPRKDVYLKPVWCETGELVMKCNSSEWESVRGALLTLFSLKNTQTRWKIPALFSFPPRGAYSISSQKTNSR